MDKLIASIVLLIIALPLSIVFFFGFVYLRNGKGKVYKVFSIVSIILTMVCVAFILYDLINILICCFNLIL